MIAGYAASSIKIAPDIGGIPDPFVADLQNATLAKTKHFRGHVASFSENSDGSTGGYEIFTSRNNLGGDANFSVNIVRAADIFKFGRIDIGAYTNSGGYAATVASITTTRNGIPPTTAGYAVGNDSYKAQMQLLTLMSRNTLWFDNEINYEDGITAADFSSRKPTLCFGNYCVQKDGTDPDYNFVAGTNEQGYELLDSLVPQVISEGAWYNNFTHAEWYNTNYMRDYFNGLNTRLGSSDVYRGSCSSVVEYYYVRGAVDSIVGLGNVITVNYTKKYPTSPYSSITTPLWIRVDLSGTNYAGIFITTSHGGRIRSMGNDVYFISVNLDFNNTSLSFTISPADIPSYLTLEKPNISIVGNSVTSDLPVKISVFRKLKAQYENDATAYERKFTFSKNHTLTLSRNTSTYDYFLAAITEEGISNITTAGIN